MPAGIENEIAALTRAPERMGHQRISTGQPTDALGQRLVRALTHLSGMPFLPGNSVRTLVNGEATFAAILEAIENDATT